jgi:hypothetical protein
MLRARETQTETPDNGRLVADTIYNTDGLVVRCRLSASHGHLDGVHAA